METVSIERVCEREGCGSSLGSLKATARFCSPNCRREDARIKGDGTPGRVWVPGRWKTVALKPSQPRTRRRNLIPGVDLTSPIIAVLNAAQSGKR